MKQFFNEFKQFAIKGNMFDMAIGIIIGTAFNKVVDVLVKKVIVPPLSLFTNNVNFADLKFVLRERSATSEEVAIGYGELAEVCIDFFIITLTIFVVIKTLNKIRDKAEDPGDTSEVTPKEIEYLSRIEALMKEQNELLKKN